MTIKYAYIPLKQILNEMGYKYRDNETIQSLISAWGVSCIVRGRLAVVPTLEWEHVRAAQLAIRRLSHEQKIAAGKKRLDYISLTTFEQRREKLLASMPGYVHPPKDLESINAYVKDVLGIESGYCATAVSDELKDRKVVPASAPGFFNLYFLSDLKKHFPDAKTIREVANRQQLGRRTKARAVEAQAKYTPTVAPSQPLPAPSQPPPVPPKPQDVPLGTILKLILGKLGKLEEGHKEILKKMEKLEGTSLLAPMDDVVSGVSLEELAKV